MYQESKVIIGKHAFSADLGVVQGGVLSPMLFNVYLEEALGETQKLKAGKEEGRQVHGDAAEAQEEAAPLNPQDHD